MVGGWRSLDWRRTAGLVLLVVAACLAAALVPHAIGGFGSEVVVTQAGPPPSVNADLEDPRQRFQNRVTNQVTEYVPLLVPAFAALAAFAAGRQRGSTSGSPVGSDAVGGFVGAAVGYALFVGVATLAYGDVEGGYLLETYPPTVSVELLAVNAVVLGVVSALGAAVAGGVARPRTDDDESAST